MPEYTDIEFDALLEQKFREYIVEHQNVDSFDEPMFESRLCELIRIWKYEFYSDVNGRPLMSVTPDDFEDISNSITTKLIRSRNQVQYVSSRVNISEESLRPVIRDVVGKFYINAPWAHS